MPRKAGLWLLLLAVVSLAIGVVWTIRTAPPSPRPWWWGKNPDVHVEVWEEGKEDATVAMTMSKKTVDAMIGLGMKSSISAGKHRVYLSEVRQQMERLPRGQWLTLHDEEATIYVWLDVKDGQPATHPPRPDGTPADTTS
ncbi:MAG TPA: hypothetical protein VFD83_00915 [Candidatus Polarisedimenticolia bacterium]|nr:hypothetical protein [Candidatus Polarisedimenticolia bacterium]